jgi:hypothetical protein
VPAGGPAGEADGSLIGDLPAVIEADEDLTWESSVWAPIQLTVMGGTEYRGREIPLAWQIEFDPTGPEFDVPNEKLRRMGVEPDGYGWSNLIDQVVKKYHSDMGNALHFGDTEEAACVIWVEAEDTCRRLVDIAWTLIHAP